VPQVGENEIAVLSSYRVWKLCVTTFFSIPYFHLLPVQIIPNAALL
jgi:hypothetical protein